MLGSTCSSKGICSNSWCIKATISISSFSISLFTVWLFFSFKPRNAGSSGSFTTLFGLGCKSLGVKSYHHYNKLEHKMNSRVYLGFLSFNLGSLFLWLITSLFWSNHRRLFNRFISCILIWSLMYRWVNLQIEESILNKKVKMTIWLKCLVTFYFTLEDCFLTFFVNSFFLGLVGALSCIGVLVRMAFEVCSTYLTKHHPELNFYIGIFFVFNWLLPLQPEANFPYHDA